MYIDYVCRGVHRTVPPQKKNLKVKKQLTKNETFNAGLFLLVTWNKFISFIEQIPVHDPTEKSPCLSAC